MLWLRKNVKFEDEGRARAEGDASAISHVGHLHQYQHACPYSFVISCLDVYIQRSVYCGFAEGLSFGHQDDDDAGEGARGSAGTKGCMGDSY